MNHINGQARAAVSGRMFETLSPTDSAVLAHVARSDAADVDAPAQAAHTAFPAWAALTGADRRADLHSIADGIVARAEEIAFVECMDTGQAFRFMSKAALRGAENFRFFADRAPEARDGKALQAPGQVNITSRKPIGPVGIITPWNTPFMLSTWKIAPALAAGCTVVHKPAEFSPLSASLLVQIAEKAGLPAGVWNVVHGYGEDAGRAVTEHPLIRAISFVGETGTGRRIRAQGAATLKRVRFELGGKNPVIVFADADLDRAVDAAGGAKVAGAGCYVQRTLITGARNDMRVAQEENFGPVLTAIPFVDEAEAMRLANDVDYGPTACLWTHDVTRAFRVSDALEAGMVWVNSENVRHLPAPFGGAKASGIGRGCFDRRHRSQAHPAGSGFGAYRGVEPRD